MENIRGKYLILNGEARDPSGYTPDFETDLYYEVIRIMNGKYLFLNDHLERLSLTCQKKEGKCPAPEIIKTHLQQLSTLSGFEEGNVKLLVYLKGGFLQTACYFIPHFYPTADQYLNGVSIKSFSFVRNDPNVKQWNEAFRNSVNSFIKEQKIFEAALLNNQGQITEGSRSNLYFIDKKERVITAPIEMVLPGITRKYVLQICYEQEIPLIERIIFHRELSTFKGCFISGTSPKILPVQKFDDQLFKYDHDTIQKIMQAFDHLIQKTVDN